MRSASEARWAFLAFAAGALALALPAAWSAGELWVDDLTRAYLPWIGFATEHLSSGRLPLWNPFSFGGMPFYTNPETALYQPFHLLLFPWLPFKHALLGVRVLDMAVAATGLFVLLRRWKLGRAAAAFGGIVFVGSGYFQFQFVHLPYVNTLAWLPFALVAVDRVLERPSITRALALGAVWAVQLTGGSAEVFLHTNLFVVLFAIFRMASESPVWGAPELRTRVLHLALALMTFVGLGAIMLVPTGQFIGHSLRSSGVDLDTMRDGLVTRSYLEHTLFPWWFYRRGAPFSYRILFDHTGQVATYVGTLPLVLACLGVLVARPARRVAFLFATALLGLALARIPESAAYGPVIEAIPPLGWFRWSHNFLILYVIAMPLLAALGLQAALACPVRGLRWGLGLGAVLAGLAFARGGETTDAVAALGLAVGAAGAGLIFRARRTWLTAPRLALLVIALSGADLLHFASRLLPLSEPGYHDFAGERALVTELKERTGHQRLTFLGEAMHQLELSLDDPFYAPRLAAGVQPLPDTTGWARREARRLARFEWLTDGVVASDPELRTGLLEPYPINQSMRDGYREMAGYDVFRMGRFDQLVTSLDRAALLRQLSVRYVVSSQPLLHPALRPAERFDHGYVYEVRDALPRAYAVCHAELGLDADAVLERLARTHHDPTRVVLIERDESHEPDASPSTDPACLADAAGRVEFITDAENEVVLRTHAQTPIWLVLNDADYPGWQSTVDDVPVEIRRANHHFRAVPVGAGEHVVSFRFRPRALALGATTTAATALAMAMAAIVTRRARCSRGARA